MVYEKYLLFVANDQLFTIWFNVAEDKRYGEFEKGFDALLASLKIVP